MALTLIERIQLVNDLDKNLAAINSVSGIRERIRLVNEIDRIVALLTGEGQAPAPVAPATPAPAPEPEPAPAEDPQTAEDRAFLQSVIDGKHPDLNKETVGERLTDCVERYDDGEHEAMLSLTETAVMAWQDHILELTDKYDEEE